jgi:hypothetical protein
MLSSASIPVTIGVLLSFQLLSKMTEPAINIILISMIAGFAGAIFSLLLWHRLRINKMLLRFEYLF